MKMKYLKQLIAIGLVLVLLVGCSCQPFTSLLGNVQVALNEPDEESSNTSEEPTSDTTPDPNNGDENNTKEYDFSIYSDDTTYTDSQLKVQSDFYEYLTQCFVDSMESSYLNLLYTVEDPEAMGIHVDEISWGNASISSMETALEDLQEEYDTLLAFDYDSLDYEGKLIYDILCEYYDNALIGSKYWYYEEVFSPLDGIQTSLPILLAEIEFNNTDDINNYLLLLEDTDRYIDELIIFEKYRAENHKIFLTDDAADSVITQCNDFINAEDNILITTFNERIDSMSGLTSAEITEYKTRNSNSVKDHVISAFNHIVDTLTSLKGTRLYDGLCNYEGGDEFYAYLTKTNSSSGRSVKELSELTDEYMNTARNEIQSIAKNNYFALLEFYNPAYPVDEPKESLNYFIDAIKADFPQAATKDFSLKYVPESLEESSSPAFYILAPIDNVNKNIIYLNGSDEYASENLYATLAHEGYPGHLYQTSYFYSINPHPIRSVLRFSGYNEGWAMYSQRYAYDYSGLSDGCVSLLKANDIYGYGLYSKIDFGVNYKGWTLRDVEKYVTSEGYDKDIAGELYTIMVNDPCVYHRYFLGMIEMIETQNHAKELLGDNYSNIDCNKFILEIGPAYYDIINERMISWAERINGR